MQNTERGVFGLAGRRHSAERPNRHYLTPYEEDGGDQRRFLTGEDTPPKPPKEASRYRTPYGGDKVASSGNIFPGIWEAVKRAGDRIVYGR